MFHLVCFMLRDGTVHGNEQAHKLESKDKAVARKLAEAKKALQTSQERQRRAYATAFGAGE